MNTQYSSLYILIRLNYLFFLLHPYLMLKDVIEGRMEGKPPRGRKRIGMIDDLKEKSYQDMKRRAEDRVSWRSWIPRTCQ